MFLAYAFSEAPSARGQEMTQRSIVLLATLTGCLALGACSGTETKEKSEEPIDEPTIPYFYEEDHSIARKWNEALLASIRLDFARPTVHARNLFHSSALMYDLWTVFDDTADSFFLGNTVGGYTCTFSAAERETMRTSIADPDDALHAAISYGMYRFLNHRFQDSPRARPALGQVDAVMQLLGYDPAFESTDFSSGDPAALGNYLASCIIEFGLQDGSNEADDYAYKSYEPVNDPMNPAVSGTPGMNDPNRWQPLELERFVDQAGNPVSSTPKFVGAEWGKVVPFALSEDDLTVYNRDSVDYWVYHDPGPPAYLKGTDALPEEYKWTHSLAVLWSSHLDPSDGVMWDISPASIGNTGPLPTTIPEMRDFYDALEGGVQEQGHTVNPATGAPYEPQMVPRGDYTRVLAEFWADGPDSETPPGHWFTILNEAVHDHPDFERRYKGEGPVLDELEWEVKAYFALGGTVHDSAITAWGAKGWYDYTRPISAIRYMASLGQSSDPDGPSYHPDGIPLVENYIEVVEAGDPLAGEEDENVGKIKVFAWQGHSVLSSASQTIGVDWILAANWWPYQRPTFVTPPFAGYVSGHSTFSRAAAELLTFITGSEYFPGGLGEFVAKKDEFLVFEEGPSQDVVLQWATYRDASDQTSLSRIWGGIHPPVDDVPGRLMGIEIAADSAAVVDSYFNGTAIP